MNKHALPQHRPSVLQGRFAMGRPVFHNAVHLPRQVVQTYAGGSVYHVPGRLDLAAGPGQPLDPDTRRSMEQAFGAAFGDVRVHVGAQAAALGARAFTAGAHIYFAPGEYDPHTAGGRRLLAHELAHVVQQRAGRVRNPGGHGLAVVHDAALEAEAERMAAAAAALAPVPSPFDPPRPIEAWGGARPPERAAPESHVPPAPPPQPGTVIQAKVKSVTLNGGVISSVSFDGKRLGHHQGGQHTTAYTTFDEMVRNHLLGKSVNDGLRALKNLVEQITYLPTFQATEWKEGADTYMATVQSKIQADIDAGTASSAQVLYWANEVLAVRNSLHLSSYKNSSSTHSGLSECKPAGALETIDDHLRKGNQLVYDPTNDVYANAWELFHFDPGTKTEPQELAAQIIQHAYSMYLSYPHVPELQDPKTTIRQGLANKLVWNRVVQPSYMDGTFKKAVEAALANYTDKNVVPQYRKKVLNSYDKLIAQHKYTLQP